MIRLALRQEFAGFVAATVLIAVIAFGTALSFGSVMGTSDAERQASARQLEQLAPYTSALLPLPRQVETLGGFISWRVFGGLPIFVAIWAVASGSGVRGDEAGGRLAAWLGSGVSRRRWIATRALSYALLAAVTCTSVTVVIVVASGLPIGAVAGQCLALWVLACVCQSISVLASQVAGSRRVAIGVAAAALGILYLANSLARLDAGPIRLLSPFGWYERTDTLLAGGSIGWLGIAASLAATLSLIGLSGVLFTSRDLGAGLLSFAGSHQRTSVPSENPVWRLPPVAALYEQRLLLVGWVVVLVAMVSSLVAMAGPIASILALSPVTRGSKRLFGNGDPASALVGVFLFGVIQLGVALFAVVQAGRWAAEDGSGRLAALLGAVSRRRVIVDRGLSLALAIGILAIAGMVTGGIVASRSGVTIDLGRLMLGGVLLIPFGLAFGGIGLVLTGLRPRLAMPFLALFTVASFFLLDFGQIFNWPEWLIRLSVFDLFGMPLSQGITWPGVAALTAIAAVGFGAAAVAFDRRDIGR